MMVNNDMMQCLVSTCRNRCITRNIKR